jgi:hypothetical protein
VEDRGEGERREGREKKETYAADREKSRKNYFAKIQRLLLSL